jgi:hypothetical protein
MRCAVVDIASNTVVNVIVADSSCPPMDGCFLVDLQEGDYCDIGVEYDTATGKFIFLPPEIELPDPSLWGPDPSRWVFPPNQNPTDPTQ